MIHLVKRFLQECPLKSSIVRDQQGEWRQALLKIELMEPTDDPSSADHKSKRLEALLDGIHAYTRIGV